jgi:hypothetical protein
MKSLKIALLAALIIAAGVVAAGAQSPYFDTLAKDYPLDAQWTTPPGVVSVFDVPTLATTDLEPELGAGALASDMAGKISGVQYMSLYFGALNNNYTNNYATFAVDVTGSISTKGTDPVVKMTLKGTGYSVDLQGNNGPGASLNLKFTSTRPVAHFHQELVAGGVTVTNDYNDLAGEFSGTVKVGKDFTYKLDKEPAWLSDAVVVHTNGSDYVYDDGFVWAVEGTDFVEVWHGSGLQIDAIPLQGQVIQPAAKNAKLSIIAGVFSGKGSVNDKDETYKATVTSVAGMRGAKLTLSGFTGNVIAGYTSTNDAGIYDPVNYPNGYIPSVVEGAIRTLNLSGKAGGQKVSQKGVNPDAPSP